MWDKSFLRTVVFCALPAASPLLLAACSHGGYGGNPFDGGQQPADLRGVGSGSDLAGSSDLTSGPQSGLAAWYRFDETSGVVLDSSPNALNGAVEGPCVRGLPGRIGQAISFDGKTARVHVPGSDKFDFLPAGTIEMWVQIPKAAQGMLAEIVNRGGPITNDSLAVGTFIGRLEGAFYRQNSGSADVQSNTSAIPSDIWTHIAVVNDGAEIRLYINGELNTSGKGGATGPIAGDLYIGGRQMNYAFKGLVDELKWWTVARTQAQICADAGGTWTTQCNL